MNGPVRRPRRESVVPTFSERIDYSESRRYKARRLWDGRLASHVIPGLPVDGDLPALRTPTKTAGSVMDAVLTDLLKEKNEFFDSLVDQWAKVFPDLPARPGRAQDGKIFLYVRTSGQMFALRPKLPKIKKILAALPGAPKRFTLHLEIHTRPGA